MSVKFDQESSSSQSEAAFDLYKDFELPDEEEKDFVFESGGPKNDLLGTICEVVMSEMYENSSVGDIESQEGSFSSSSGGSSGSSIMNKLNHKLQISSHAQVNQYVETKLNIPKSTVP